jgi:hypothetical protein
LIDLSPRAVSGATYNGLPQTATVFAAESGEAERLDLEDIESADTEPSRDK